MDHKQALRQTALYSPLVWLCITLISSPALADFDVNAQRIEQADKEPGNWLSHGRTYDEQRFSPLTSVNTANVSSLGLAWVNDLGTKRGLEATPIVVDGVMFLSGTWSVVYALDAKTGKELWKYDPQVDRGWAFHACCDVVNRGVAIWEGVVYVGTLDGRLVALNAEDGSLLWESLTIDKRWPYAITGAPRIVKGKVLIGNGGAEMGVRGYISAYDAKTGEMAWRFYTVPGDPAKGFENEAMAMAAKTWTGEWWKVGGGGTVWDSMAYDPELDLLYIGVGNAGPWNIDERSPQGGDNLFVSSIVALRPDTGEYVWHYQTTPGDRWDYTATQHIILADLEVDGKPRKLLMQAPKNGFFYVLDRSSGELISANNYVPVNWASSIDTQTGRPVFNEEADYTKGKTKVEPSFMGGHNWHPSAFNPQTGLVYIPAIVEKFEYEPDPNYQYQQSGGLNLGIKMLPILVDGLLIEVAVETLNHGQLLAWDPIKQAPAWKVEHHRGYNAGVVTTAGNLVFQAGTDGRMVAYNAENGEKLWEDYYGIGTQAAPVTYSVDGEQYIAIVAGWGGSAIQMAKPKSDNESSAKGAVLAWKLNGNAQAPDIIKRSKIAPYIPELSYTETQVEKGADNYAYYCARCHGTPTRGNSVLPDLGLMSKEVHELFDPIVRGGLYQNKGMRGLADLLSEQEVKDIHAYLVDRSKEYQDELDAPQWWIAVKTWFYEKLVSLQ